MGQDFSWAELGSRIRDLRIQNGLSQQMLAEKAGITQPGIARIESGQTNPQLDTLRKIATALKTCVRRLLTGSATEEEPEAHPLIRRIARVLDSGDHEAIETIANAVATAEALLRRSGRVVADFSPTAPPDKNRTQAEPDRWAGIARTVGIDHPATVTEGKVSGSGSNYKRMLAGSKYATWPRPYGKPVTKPRKGFESED
jgi:transcriptional regulator with XRE-family HTH domain